MVKRWYIFAVWAVISALLGAPTVAQNRITADQFLDIATGRTLHFHNMRSGRLVGIEEFLRRDLSVWKPRGQDCVYGRITIEEGLLCFLYDNETPDEKSCWYVFEDNDQLMVRGPRVFNPDLQIVEQITDKPLDCPNAPTS